VAVDNTWLKDPQGAGIVRQKAVEHEAMESRARSADEMRNFLNSAPDGITYDRFKSIIGSN
jgi:hypothetical protein